MRWIVVLLIFFSSSQVNATWHRAESENFIVYSKTNAQLIDKFTHRLEQLSSLLRVQTGVEVDPDAPKLLVFAVDGKAGVRRAMGAGSRDVAGFYSAKITGSFIFVPRGSGASSAYDLGAETVLFHEYAHHFMLQHFPRGYPAWFVEGFAEFYSTTAFNKDGSVSIGLPAMHRAYSLVFGTPLPMERMLAADPGKMTSDETERFYAWSWVLTHYLMSNNERKAKFDNYLRDYGRGNDPLTAAKAAFGDLDALRESLAKYAMAPRIMTRKVSGWKPPIAQISIEPLTTAQAATMPLLMQFVQWSSSKQEVDLFFRDAQKNALRYPDEPLALEMLAEGALDAENLDVATNANDKLLSKKPTDARALLRRARIAAAQMRKSGVPGGWSAVRKLIVKANRAAPNDPFALSEYYDTYGQEGTPAPAIAVDGLRRALDLVPQVTTVRLNLARRLKTDGKIDDARAVLMPLLNNPHSAEVREAARTLLDAQAASEKMSASGAVNANDP